MIFHQSLEKWQKNFKNFKNFKVGVSLTFAKSKGTKILFSDRNKSVQKQITSCPLRIQNLFLHSLRHPCVHERSSEQNA